MARPYSKKTVDQAEEILLVYIRRDFDTDNVGYGIEGYARELGIEGYTTAARLARAAWDVVRPALPSETASEVAVEAAALIRSGWMIGDPIELLLPVETDVVENATQVATPVDMQHEAASLQAQIDNPEITYPRLPGLAAGYPAAEPCGSYAKAMAASVPDPVDLEPVEYVADTYSNGDYGADS